MNNHSYTEEANMIAKNCEISGMSDEEIRKAVNCVYETGLKEYSNSFIQFLNSTPKGDYMLLLGAVLGVSKIVCDSQLDEEESNLVYSAAAAVTDSLDIVRISFNEDEFYRQLAEQDDSDE